MRYLAVYVVDKERSGHGEGTEEPLGRPRCTGVEPARGGARRDDPQRRAADARRGPGAERDRAAVDRRRLWARPRGPTPCGLSFRNCGEGVALFWRRREADLRARATR